MTEEPTSVTGIRRGCGYRTPGGLYVCSGLSPYGRPLSEFVIDPPILYEGEPFRAPQLFERDGVKHLKMFVGAEHYPFASDFLEESRRYGVSKRIPNRFPVEQLEPGSMLYLIHPRAIVADYEALPLPEYCPKDVESHRTAKDECCLGYSYLVAEANSGISLRQIGDTSYEVYPHSMGGEQHEYHAGFFLVVPITHFDHILVGEAADSDIVSKETALPINLERD